MNPINNVGGNNPVQQVQNTTGTHANQPAQTTPAPARGSDRLELSGMSQMLQTLKTNDVRGDKVATVKAQIANGTYEDDHKLDVATNRLLDDISK